MTTNKKKILENIHDAGIIAILRRIPENRVEELVQTLIENGIVALEITVDTQGAFALIKRIASAFPEAIVGAGTVLDKASAINAVESGASFLLSPNTEEEVISVAKQSDVLCFPGAMTPTEIVHAWNLGADAVKIFPADSLSVGYIRAMRAPLPHIPIIPVGGISADNIGEFVAAGAFAFGVGGNLVRADLVSDGNFTEIARISHRIVGNYREALTMYRKA